jgi:hypothetical protein
LNKINSDARDIQVLTEVFRNTFDCLAGDCNYKQLPKNISSKTPSGCFNLQSDYITPLATAIITAFNTDEIDSNAKRTCMFYEFMALEPQAFGLPRDAVASKVNALFGMNSANAVGKLLVDNPPFFSNYSVTKIAEINATSAANMILWLANKNAHYANCNSYSEAYGCGTHNNCSDYSTVYSCLVNAGATLGIRQAYDGSVNGFALMVSNIANEPANVAQQIAGINILFLSIKGETNPVINKDAMWDMRTSTITTQAYPKEASNLPYLIGKQMLIARNTSTNNINSTDIDGNVIPVANDNMAGFDASFSKKLDAKFDDGKPYTGNIIAGKNVADLANTSGCTNVSLANFAAVTSNLGASYANGKSLDGGCVVGFVVKT